MKWRDSRYQTPPDNNNFIFVWDLEQQKMLLLRADWDSTQWFAEIKRYPYWCFADDDDAEEYDEGEKKSADLAKLKEQIANESRQFDRRRFREMFRSIAEQLEVAKKNGDEEAVKFLLDEFLILKREQVHRQR